MIITYTYQFLSYENIFEIIYDTIKYAINFFYTFQNKCSVSILKSKLEAICLEF